MTQTLHSEYETTCANQETLGLPSGFRRGGGVRQQGLSYQDPDTGSEKSSEGERNTDESDQGEGNEKLAQLTSSDSDVTSVKSDESTYRKGKAQIGFFLGAHTS